MLANRIGRSWDSSRARSAISPQPSRAIPPQPDNKGKRADPIRPSRALRPVIRIQVPRYADTKRGQGSNIPPANARGSCSARRVIGRLAGDGHVVDVAFAEARIGDPDEPGLALQRLDRR